MDSQVLRWPSLLKHPIVTMVYKTSYSLRILGFEPVEQGIFVEGSSGSTVTVVPLDIGDGV